MLVRMFFVYMTCELNIQKNYICKHTTYYYAVKLYAVSGVRQAVTRYIQHNVHIIKQVRTQHGAGSKKPRKFGWIIDFTTLYKHVIILSLN